MARTKANYDARKHEILQSVWNVLLKYGYEQMTINVIIHELSISRGAFYHYFNSKEECADAAVAEYVSDAVTKLRNMDCYDENACQRLKQAIKNAVFLFHGNTEQHQIINKSENKVFHQKLMIALTKNLASFYAEIIQDGVAKNEFETSFPLETSEMLLTLSNFYLDIVLFQWNQESMKEKVMALEELTNKALGTKKYVAFFDFYEEEK